MGAYEMAIVRPYLPMISHTKACYHSTMLKKALMWDNLYTSVPDPYKCIEFTKTTKLLVNEQCGCVFYDFR